MERELSLPTLFATLQWAFAVALLATITYFKKQNQSSYAHWLALTLIMSYLLIDESLALHEETGRYFHRAKDTSPFFYFGWVIPYSVLVVIMAFTFLKFLLTLPRRILLLFFLAGGIFVLGTLIVEMISARHAMLHGFTPFYWLVLIPIEEALEMIGLTIFIYALLIYISTELKGLSVQVRPEEEREPKD